MSDSNTPRLMAAAKEFNIGKDTLIEFLAGKGFNKEDLKPTAKLTEAMYRSLQAEFSSDKAAKAKSDQIEIPKGGMGEHKKKKEDEEVLFKKETKKVVVKEEPKVEEVPAPEPVAVVEPQPPVEEVVQPTVEPVKEEVAPEQEAIKRTTPEIEGPKVIAKIDLDKIDGSTRPKKSVKKKEEEPKEAPKETPKPVVETPAPVAEVTAVTPAPQETDAPEVVIENIKAEVLEGPKILGKIELPINSDTRPKPVDKEKRKRKRIPIDKKGNQPAIED
ncbi:MAG: translation initiation factor IF-2, partial [Bacteroidota bacterium]